MRAYRIVKARYADTCLNGQGAHDSGGRWNSRGRAVVYAGSSVALCTLEMLVHLNDVELLQLAYNIIELDIPDDLVETLDPDKLPEDWAMPEHPECKRIGDAWLASGRGVALLVPSAVVPMERNLLLNPAHPDFGRITSLPAQAIAFDPRLLGNGAATR